MEKNTKKYNILRVVTVIQSALILIAVIFIAFSGIINNDEEYQLAKSESLDGAYTIELYEVGSPNLFRTNKVKAYYRDADHRQSVAVFTAEVNNGEKPLDKSNFTLEWDGDTAVLYLEGSEQTKTRYEINFETVSKE